MMTQTPSPPTDLTPKHIRAARALLAWSQQDLAKQARVATSTVADFERGHRNPVANNAQAIRGTLESAGIQFLSTGAVIGPPIPRIATSERPGVPIRWVDAADLSAWADRLDSAARLPTFLAHLIRATHGSAIDLRFPSDEGIRHSGWDGLTATEQGSQYVPQGKAGWEISCQRKDIATKATSDYNKRTSEPTPLDPATSVYIFVTPRHWSEKDKWSAARRTEGPWRDVRVYDANDLVHWIEQAPAVGQCLAAHLGKRPPGTRELEEIWEEWSLATKWPLTEELVCSDRDEDVTAVLRWLRGEPSVLSIQATTTEEVAAFFHAALKTLPEEIAAYYRARCLVVIDPTAARMLANAPTPLILLLTEPDPGLAHSLARRGHLILQAYDDRPVGPGEVRRLAQPSRAGIARALTEAGIPESRAHALARDSARNLAILRRLIPSAPGRLPDWAEKRPPQALLAALLAGGWNETSEADRVKLAELAGAPYDHAVGVLTAYVGELDSPLRKVGSTWRVASPFDAWPLLARYLTDADIGRFETIAHEVLGSVDPRYDMDSNERWSASIHGVRPKYSEFLRHGIGEILILLALVRIVPDAQQRTDAIVGRLLRNTDQRRWWSLSTDFRLLAEASPSAFLEAIEDSLDQDNPSIRVLFKTDEGSVLGREYLADLLWALESLAWSPELLSRVSLVLARLDTIDSPPGKHQNRPANSLRKIYLPWIPQTFASLDLRLHTLDLIRKNEPDAAWKLMLNILPQGYDSSTPSATPRWRDYTVDTPEIATWYVIGRAAAAVSERLLADAGLNISRWLTLLERLGDIVPNREAVIACLETVEQQITNKADRASLWAGLRKELHHHRQFPNAEWSLPEPELERLANIYEHLTPADAIERVAWLFDQAPSLPNPTSEGWQAEEQQIGEERRRAARDVYTSQGVGGILSLARLASSTWHIGHALFDANLDDADLDALLEASLRSETPREHNVAWGLIETMFRERNEPWAERLIAKAHEQGWSDMALLTILRALPPQRWTWGQAIGCRKEIDEAYWRSVPILWMRGNAEDIVYAARKLIAVGRARHAVHLVGRDNESQIPSVFLIEALTEAVRQPFDSDGDVNESTMFQHYVTEILKQLDERPDVSDTILVTLEWTYLPVLQRSRRPVKVLLKALAKDPAFFIQMLSAVFKPSEENDALEPEMTDPEQARTIARHAYRLLELWDHLPGTRDDGGVDVGTLETWIREARSLAKAAGLKDIADSRIGTVLSGSPVGSDGIWPAEAIREVIEIFRSKPMIEGFLVGKRNRRGATVRMPHDGGQPERSEAATYRTFAAVLVNDHPRTAKALYALADSYEFDARREDEDAERLDWGP